VGFIFGFFVLLGCLLFCCLLLLGVWVFVVFCGLCFLLCFVVCVWFGLFLFVVVDCLQLAVLSGYIWCFDSLFRVAKLLSDSVVYGLAAFN
jgi:hypothetical protein